MALEPNLDSEKNRHFWKSVQEGAQRYRDLPPDRKGVLGERQARPLEGGADLKSCDSGRNAAPNGEK